MALTPGRPVPPGNEDVLQPDGQLTQPWAAYFRDVSAAQVTRPELAAVTASATAATAAAAAADARITAIGAYASVNVPVTAPLVLTTGVVTDIASLALGAGDWDVWGSIGLTMIAPVDIAYLSGWITDTSGAGPVAPDDSGGGAYFRHGTPFTTTVPYVIPAGTRRALLAAPATLYLGVLADFSVASLAGYGFLAARRRAA